jgi:hypothetical protein
MDTLKISLENCYGISRLNYEFDFRPNVEKRSRAKAHAIYAPNGTMKSSFSRVFYELMFRRKPIEEVYDRKASWVVHADNKPIDPDAIYVLKADIDITQDPKSVTNILVNTADKSEYDELIVELEKSKIKVVNKLSKASKVKKDDIETNLFKDFNANSLADALNSATQLELEPLTQGIIYAEIFHEKAISVFDSDVFAKHARDFSQRYEELFVVEGTIYRKGVFSPTKAENSLKALKNHGYFDGGHRVHLEGDDASLTEREFKERLDILNSKVDDDADLRKLRTAISLNAQTQAISNLLEQLSNEEIEFLIENIQPSNRLALKKLLWAEYVSRTPEVIEYIDLIHKTEASIREIEERASQLVAYWYNAIKLFNDRFVDMPFKLKLDNPADTVLGRKPAKLIYVFDDGRSNAVELERSSLKTLSQGEKRALYLLNFIFDVEERRQNAKETLFIIDDVADSFDYKNKHAIVQYLNDLTENDLFHQIILTHNFDFYRSISTLFVHRERCLMTSKGSEEITLLKADGVNNVFINKWKPRVSKCDKTLCASVPFIRNIVEYTRSEKDTDFLLLTKLLHWKNGSQQVTEGDFYKVWNIVFGTNLDESSVRVMCDVLLDTAQQIVDQTVYEGICLEDKVVLSIAIRLNAEKFMVEKIRLAKNIPEYWYEGKSQFGKLVGEFIRHIGDVDSERVLEQVGVTVSSNIHLNSFMYEPILDLSIEHLVDLYEKVKQLK